MYTAESLRRAQRRTTPLSVLLARCGLCKRPLQHYRHYMVIDWTRLSRWTSFSPILAHNIIFDNPSFVFRWYIIYIYTHMYEGASHIEIIYRFYYEL